MSGLKKSWDWLNKGSDRQRDCGLDQECILTELICPVILCLYTGALVQLQRSHCRSESSVMLSTGRAALFSGPLVSELIKRLLRVEEMQKDQREGSRLETKILMPIQKRQWEEELKNELDICEEKATWRRVWEEPQEGGKCNKEEMKSVSVMVLIALNYSCQSLQIYSQ